MSEAIEFPAEIIKIQTMVDGAIRLTLDLPVGEIETASKLIEAKQRGAVLECAVIPVLQIQTEENGKIPERSKRKSEWASA